MRALSAPELLGVWERGLVQQPAERALALLAAACPGTPPEALAKLSIGQRDATLLALRELTFGPEYAGLTTCSGCAKRLELTFDVAEIQMGPEGEPAETASLTVTDYELRFRLPNSLDLAAVTEQTDVARARLLLFDRCLLSADHRGKEMSADQLPAEVIDAVAERMAQADPQADVQLAISCPSCGHQWRCAFDIVSFFWAELNAWACRILREVHQLASVYGWHEADILAMSPWRRQTYLEIVGV